MPAKYLLMKGDDRLLADLFAPHPPRDSYRRATGFMDGAMSILVGIAANRSMRTGRPVRIGQRVKFN